MRFWDSSALGAFFIPEVASTAVREWFQSDPEVIVWALTRVELRSALARRHREQPELADDLRLIWNEMVSASERWFTLSRFEEVCTVAERVLASHPLRAADALQLGAAIVAADGEPESLQFVTLDSRLADAARREGFDVLI
jgi:predicted nucleic acid-binding protein